MVKPGLGLFTGRRKSQGNAFEDVEIGGNSPEAAAPPPAADGGFRLLSRTEVEKANERKKSEKEKSSKFPRFSSFGTGSKGRHQSFDDESPGSSKRDSKSSSGTQFSSRPYTNGQHGSTSTLPSSTDTSSDDNLFANLSRPQIPQHNSSPNAYSMKSIRKNLPALPKTNSGSSFSDMMHSGSNTRNRAMTTSSYASTAVPPTLNTDLDFGSGAFGDDMFSGLQRNDSPPEPSREVAGRSLLSDKRTFQAEPITINHKLDIEPPLKSWESRGSADKLMSSTHSDDESPPPPPPHHKFSSYAPVASESPTLQQNGTFHDFDAQHVRKSFMESKAYGGSSPEPMPNSTSSSYANSYDTPISSRSASNKTNNATPKAATAPVETAYTDVEEQDDLFSSRNTPPKPPQMPRSSTTPALIESRAAASGPSGRVMTQAEFREYQKTQASKPAEDDSDDDYEDEEDAIKKREEEEILRRKTQQMHFAREAMRRSTTAPGRPESIADTLTMGFPSETSMKADEWEDEDVPLGILAQHGFPSQTRNRFPTQPHNAIPSHFPDRPASAGAASNRVSQAHLPAFARNLPVDPYIGGGLVRPTNRESMGFNSFGRGPSSVAGDAMGGGMGMSSPLMYQDAGLSQPSLVDQIQMRDMTKQKYMGGASNKKPQGGPFTGLLGGQMNAAGQPANPMRMSQMPMNGMNGMNGMNPMMGMMGGQMPMNGMNPQMDQFMQFQQFQQMQQMMAMQQMQMQMQGMQQPPQQDPRMSMTMPNNGSGFLNVPGVSLNGQQRPMSYMSGMNGGGMAEMQQQQRPMSTFAGPQGYTPSIAPSERSNIGLSARYRTVNNNGNHSDSMSNGTSMTLQASSGANQRLGVKGILKKGSTQPSNEEDEDWSKMAARKSRMIPTGKENPGQQDPSLEELTRGLNI